MNLNHCGDDWNMYPLAYLTLIAFQLIYFVFLLPVAHSFDVSLPPNFLCFGVIFYHIWSTVVILFMLLSAIALCLIA